MLHGSGHKPGNFSEREEARLRRISGEMEGRAKILSEEHERLKLEVQTGAVSFGGIHFSGDDQSALRRFVERKIQADGEIQREYSDPRHPYWTYKCAEYGIKTFNLRILCPKPRLHGFLEAFSGCFCTKYKTHMLDGWSTPKEVTALVEQAHRIGHPYEIVFVPEGREGVVEQLKATGVLENPRIVLWMNPLLGNPPCEERKYAVRNQTKINAIDSNDMGALFFPPTKSKVGVDLVGSLTGLDMWTDLARAGNLVRINYEGEMYRPPYTLLH